jgi:hypothetical protein
MKSVVIYCYFKSLHSDFNLSFFVKKELSRYENLNVNYYRETNEDLKNMSDDDLRIHYEKHGKNEGRKPNNLKKTHSDIDYIIVINGHDYNEKINFPNLDNLTIIKRDNIGFDFGGYNSGIEYIQQNNKSYDYYFFMNSGVIGPILPDYFTENHWTELFTKKINDKVKLVGTTIVCLPETDESRKYGPKVEGFFFMVDNIGLHLLKEEKTIFCDHIDKKSTIINGEYGLSNCILNNGYSIDCMLPRYQNIDWTNNFNYNLNNNIHPSRENSFYGYSINPYDVIFHKWYWSYNNSFVNYNIIIQYVKECNLDNILYP